MAEPNFASLVGARIPDQGYEAQCVQCWRRWVVPVKNAEIARLVLRFTRYACPACHKGAE